MRNESTFDRMVRAFGGLSLILVGFFWLGGVWPFVLYLLGAILLLTSIVGVCPLYRVCPISTYRKAAKPVSRMTMALFILLLGALLIGGGYASNFFSKKIFLEEYNAMNTYYKQALFYSGNNDRTQAVQNYEQLVVAYGDFQAKYTTYHPYIIKGDAQFNADLARISGIITNAAPLIHTGDLHEAHVTLEGVRPAFQEIFKRNDFSMFAIALVDFHDAMELILDAATAKDPQKIITLYPQVSDRLKAVESESNDAEIQAIRKNLDGVLQLAQAGQSEELAKKAADLKSSFVKVYLTRG
ncbi:MAG: DUF2892 domain-containing protein [Caldilineaceae bacterium]